MAPNYAADTAVRGFYIWVPDEQPSEPQSAFTCLLDLIEDWLERGSAVEDCCEDFTTFLAAVIIIIAEWHRGLHLPDYPLLVAMTTVADPEKHSYTILEPGRFMVIRQAHRQERAEQMEQLLKNTAPQR